MGSWRNEQNFADNVKVSEMELVQLEGMENMFFDQITFKLLNHKIFGAWNQILCVMNLKHLWGFIIVKQNIWLALICCNIDT